VPENNIGSFLSPRVTKTTRGFFDQEVTCLRKTGPLWFGGKSRWLILGKGSPVMKFAGASSPFV
jgi:hypothetical protein